MQDLNERAFTIQKGGTMKRGTMIATTVAALAGLWLPVQAQTATINTAAVQDSGKRTEATAKPDAAQNTDANMESTMNVGARDTVYLMEKWHHHSFWKEEGARQLWREKGYGVGGGFTPAVMAIDCRPVKELVANLPAVNANGYTFGTLNYQPIYVSGGMGYLGVGNDVRIGGAGLSGEKYLVGNGISSDSTNTLRLRVEYGGFLLEKAFVHYRANYLVGGSIGGGTLTATARTGQIPAQGSDRVYTSVTANFLLMEAHGGVTYSILPWLHMGADASLPFFYAAEGFQGYTTPFVTVNPVFRARIMLGNLG
jgi:hypothetical protein